MFVCLPACLEVKDVGLQREMESVCPPKICYLPTSPHGITTQKANIGNFVTFVSTLFMVQLISEMSGKVG
jgi:hypothetical protein